ncbi:hypothetical protein CCUS01_00020 [Colletotrichum cuscutae]|uniref:Uncharacterized protein n=1 Tax=Colletotrichum cuscutae TaxID=1209917 RepID=A0AAI9YDK4_9PEZI|nr:hypothetical protein CCUS01_00020 [Colletotrichum cuscutae]
MCSLIANTRTNYIDPKASLEFEKGTKKAAKLLYNIKGACDELNILRTIANYQQGVQKKLINPDYRRTLDTPATWEDETAAYVMDDIDELDQLATKTEDALKTTITILKSGTANEQGKKVMVFTLVTVFFVTFDLLMP